MPRRQIRQSSGLRRYIAEGIQRLVGKQDLALGATVTLA